MNKAIKACLARPRNLCAVFLITFLGLLIWPIFTPTAQAEKSSPSITVKPLATSTTSSTTTTTLAPTTTTAKPTATKPKTVAIPKENSEVDPSGQVETDIWKRLRDCESLNAGGYLANTGNGYYGAYQFSKSTWDSMNTGYAWPHEAPPAVQDDAAKRLQARSGWGQWPACSKKLGLR